MPMIMLGSTSGLKTEGMLLDFGLLLAKLAHWRAGFGVTLLALELRVRTNFQLMERLLPEMASLRTRRTNTGVWLAWTVCSGFRKGQGCLVSDGIYMYG
jgi:hypothetical protein